MPGKTQITIKGADEMKKKLAGLSDAVAGAKVRIALRAGALVVLNSAKERVPVRTGTLRRSLAIEDGPGPLEVSIGSDVEYAPYVEFGTSKMAARPYLRPALDENIGEVQTVIGEALWELLQGAL